MPQFMNYSQPTMNPYQNNYPQPMQMQNPYMDRMNQLQQYQQSLQMQPAQMQNTNQPQPMGLNCRIIDDFNLIVANDVPMDGNGAVFMKRDGSEVQWRNWAANGTIVTTSYLPVIEQNQSESTNIPQNDFTALNEGINAFREEILTRLDSIEKSIAKPAASKTKKTEVSADE